MFSSSAEGMRLVARIDAVDVGEEDVARLADDAHLVLHVQSQLEVVAPVAAVEAVVGQDGVLKEDPQAVEILADAVQHDDVRRDHQEVAAQLRIRLVESCGRSSTPAPG